MHLGQQVLRLLRRERARVPADAEPPIPEARDDVEVDVEMELEGDVDLDVAVEVQVDVELEVEARVDGEVHVEVEVKVGFDPPLPTSRPSRRGCSKKTNS